MLTPERRSEPGRPTEGRPVKQERTISAHAGANPARPGARRADGAVEELQLVGGETTQEGRALTAAAAAAGLTVRWLDLASPEAQAAMTAQGRGNVRLPLVIVGGTYTLQRPPFTAVSACVASLRSGGGRLPAEHPTARQASLAAA